MKKIILSLIFCILVISCTAKQNIAGNNDTEQSIKPEKNEDGEWDLEVLDTNFYYFLNAIAKPENMYSETFLKTKNIFLVNEWNNYFYSGKYRNIIESSIDYSPNTKYGKSFEYKLYQVFAFVSWKYGLNLSALGGADKTW